MNKEMNAHEFMKTMEGLINSPKANRRTAEAENRLEALKYAVNDVFGVAELHRKMALAIVKKVFGNKGSYFNKIKRWVNDYNEES